MLSQLILHGMQVNDENRIKFNQDLALQLLESEVEFPIDFEDAWTWLSWYDKSTGKRALLNCGFVEELDFHISAEATTTGISAIPKESIFLTSLTFTLIRN